MKKPLAVKFNEMMLAVLVISGFVGLVLWGALGMTESNRKSREENCQREYATVACLTVKLQEAQAREEYKRKVDVIRGKEVKQ
jgi:hypothetical protein